MLAVPAFGMSGCERAAIHFHRPKPACPLPAPSRSSGGAGHFLAAGLRLRTHCSRLPTVFAANQPPRLARTLGMASRSDAVGNERLVPSKLNQDRRYVIDPASVERCVH